MHQQCMLSLKHARSPYIKVTIRKVELNNLENRSMKRIKIITIMITKMIIIIIIIIIMIMIMITKIMIIIIIK